MAVSMRLYEANKAYETIFDDRNRLRTGRGIGSLPAK